MTYGSCYYPKVYYTSLIVSGNKRKQRNGFELPLCFLNGFVYIRRIITKTDSRKDRTGQDIHQQIMKIISKNY